MEIIEVNYPRRRLSRQMSEEFRTALAVNNAWIKYRNSIDHNLTKEERHEKITKAIQSALDELKLE